MTTVGDNDYRHPPLHAGDDDRGVEFEGTTD
jgi:hypothetical protein